MSGIGVICPDRADGAEPACGDAVGGDRSGMRCPSTRERCQACRSLEYTKFPWQVIATQQIDCTNQGRQLICSIPIRIEWSTVEFLQHDPAAQPHLGNPDVWGSSLVYYVVLLGNKLKGMDGSDARGQGE